MRLRRRRYRRRSGRNGRRRWRARRNGGGYGPLDRRQLHVIAPSPCALQKLCGRRVPRRSDSGPSRHSRHRGHRRAQTRCPNRSIGTGPLHRRRPRAACGWLTGCGQWHRGPQRGTDIRCRISIVDRAVVCGAAATRWTHHRFADQRRESRSRGRVRRLGDGVGHRNLAVLLVEIWGAMVGRVGRSRRPPVRERRLVFTTIVRVRVVGDGSRHRRRAGRAGTGHRGAGHCRQRRSDRQIRRDGERAAAG